MEFIPWPNGSATTIPSLPFPTTLGRAVECSIAYVAYVVILLPTAVDGKASGAVLPAPQRIIIVHSKNLRNNVSNVDLS
jgi:hypothetical protein